jgi:hypothetical protein
VVIPQSTAPDAGREEYMNDEEETVRLIELGEDFGLIIRSRLL